MKDNIKYIKIYINTFCGGNGVLSGEGLDADGLSLGLTGDGLLSEEF